MRDDARTGSGRAQPLKKTKSCGPECLAAHRKSSRAAQGVTVRRAAWWTRCGTKVAADEEVNMLRLLTPLTAALSTLFSSAQVLAADQLRSLSNLPPTDALVIGFVLGALLMALIVKLNRE